MLMSVSILDRATVDLNLRLLNDELSNVRDAQQRKSREKDVELRTLKKAELQLKMTTDTLQQVQQRHDATQTSKADVCPIAFSRTVAPVWDEFFGFVNSPFEI